MKKNKRDVKKAGSVRGADAVAILNTTSVKTGLKAGSLPPEGCTVCGLANGPVRKPNVT